MRLELDYNNMMKDFVGNYGVTIDEIESYAEYIDIRELIDDVVAEIEFLQNTMVELESVGYDASYIQKVQERFQTEFGSHSKGRRYYDEQKKWSRLDY